MAMSDRSSPITSPNSNRGIGPSFYGSQTRPWRSKTLPPRYQIPGRSAERTVSPTRVRQDKQKSRFFGLSDGPQTSTIVNFSDWSDKQPGSGTGVI